MKLKRIETIDELKIGDLLFVDISGDNYNEDGVRQTDENIWSVYHVKCIDNKAYATDLYWKDEDIKINDKLINRFNCYYKLVDKNNQE